MAEPRQRALALSTAEWIVVVSVYIAALRTAPVCALVVNASGAKGYACMLYNSRATAAGSGAQ